MCQFLGNVFIHTVKAGLQLYHVPCSGSRPGKRTEIQASQFSFKTNEVDIALVTSTRILLVRTKAHLRGSCKEVWKTVSNQVATHIQFEL